jgi:hypothetical protein
LSGGSQPVPPDAQVVGIVDDGSDLMKVRISDDGSDLMMVCIPGASACAACKHASSMLAPCFLQDVDARCLMCCHHLATWCTRTCTHTHTHTHTRMTHTQTHYVSCLGDSLVCVCHACVCVCVCHACVCVCVCVCVSCLGDSLGAKAAKLGCGASGAKVVPLKGSVDAMQVPKP